MADALTRRWCVPCEGGMSPLPREQAGALFSELPDGWVLGEASLDASFRFRTYLDGIAFVNRVAELAEA